VGGGFSIFQKWAKAELQPSSDFRKLREPAGRN